MIASRKNLSLMKPIFMHIQVKYRPVIRMRLPKMVCSENASKLLVLFVLKDKYMKRMPKISSMKQNIIGFLGILLSLNDFT